MISRRQARRQALFLLYQWDLSGQEIGSQYAEELDSWAKALAEETAANAAALDERITAAAEGWTADRLGVVERSALRVAIRLIRQAIVTVSYDTEHEMRFHRNTATVATARSVATSIREIGGTHKTDRSDPARQQAQHQQRPQ